MKRGITVLLVCLMGLLVPCADSSTVGTDLDKRYDINLNVYNNHAPVDISIPVAVEAESRSATTQETDDTAEVKPVTDVKLPISAP